MTFTVLLCSAGRRVELVRIFQQALDQLGIAGRVIATDVSPLAAAGQAADAFHRVPASDSPEFLPEMLDLSLRESVGLIVPTTDTTLVTYARCAGAFREVGTTVAISTPGTVAVASDKRLTWEFFVAHGITTVRQTDVAGRDEAPEDWPYPLIVKPVNGSSSIGVATVNDDLDLAAWSRGKDVVLQEVAQGDEYTIDVFVDQHGRLRDAVPRRRLAVRAGEVSKAVTVRAEPLLRLARDVVDALPGCYGVLNVQCFWDGAGAPVAIEVNPRFGGGFPLTHASGAPFVRWLLETALSRECTPASSRWADDLLMLRYDDAMLCHDATRRGLL